MTAPIPAEWVTTVADALATEDARNWGYDHGFGPDDPETEAFANVALSAALPLIVESIAAGFDALAAAALEHQRGLDQDDRDIDVVLAWECAARWIREHAANRPTAVAAAVSSPTGTPGARCPSRIAHESGAVLRCQRQEHPLALAHMSADRRVFWTPLDDRVIDSYGPATSPTGDRP